MQSLNYEHSKILVKGRRREVTHFEEVILATVRLTLKYITKTKHQLQSSQSQNKLGIKSAKVSRQVTTDAVNAEILSRNGREDGQIDLRIDTRRRQTSAYKAILTKVGNSNEPISTEDL